MNEEQRWFHGRQLLYFFGSPLIPFVRFFRIMAMIQSGMVAGVNGLPPSALSTNAWYMSNAVSN
jgi:hypothetical protein